MNKLKPENSPVKTEDLTSKLTTMDKVQSDTIESIFKPTDMMPGLSIKKVLNIVTEVWRPYTQEGLTVETILEGRDLFN